MVKKKNCVIWIQIVSLIYKINYIYKDIKEDVKNKFDTSNYQIDRPLLKGKNKTVIGLMKDELDRKIITKFVELRVKTYGYLIDDGSEDKKEQKAQKNVS